MKTNLLMLRTSFSRLITLKQFFCWVQCEDFFCLSSLLIGVVLESQVKISKVEEAYSKKCQSFLAFYEKTKFVFLTISQKCLRLTKSIFSWRHFRFDKLGNCHTFDQAVCCWLVRLFLSFVKQEDFNLVESSSNWMNFRKVEKFS